MKRVILIATDGSAAASAAVETGLEIAAVTRSTVRFVHASWPLADEIYGTYVSAGGPSPDEIIARDPVLADAVARAQEAGVEANVELLANEDTANLAASIAGVADGVGASLVVVGSRGRGVIAGSLLGSVSQRLLTYASIPVLVVRGRARTGLTAAA
jgi:nucleotide-binding universal stress UspA family protein